MSDQGFDQQQQGGYPPQQPGGVPAPPPPPPGTFPEQPVAPQSPPVYPQAPPPAYQQQPAYGQPPAYQPPAEPPKKKGKGGIIALVIAVVVLCGLVTCGVLAVSLFKGGSSDTSTIAQAEKHFDAAVSAVEVANASLGSLNQGTPSAAQVSKIVGDTGTSLRTARDEIASARAIADQWKDSQGKTDYLAGLAATTSTLDSLQDLVGYVNTANGMLAKAKQGGTEAAAGNADLNAAIKAGNRSRYSTMRTKAQSAQTHYVKAALLFREAHTFDRSAGLDRAAKYADLRKKQADVVVRMAAEGSAHRYSAYNSDIKKMNNYSDSAEKVGEPAIVSDSNWAAKRLAAIEKKITDASKKADDLRKKALQELGYTK